MASCPFCKGTVAPDLLVNGGVCPLCLIEIPGEEAATNPGLAAVERQRQEEQAARRRRLPFLVGGTVLALLAVGTLGARFLMVEEPAVLDLGEESFARVPLTAHQNVYVDEPETVEPVGTKRSGSSTKTASSGGSGAATPATGGQLASSASTSPGRAAISSGSGSISKQIEDVDPTQAMGGGGLQAGPSISVGSRGASEVLTDAAEIAEMTRRIVARNSRQLEDCYNDRLKADETLEGRWRVAFEIQKDGSAQKVEVVGLGRADAGLEACMADKVSRWRFQRIGSPQGVSKNYSFTR